MVIKSKKRVTKLWLWRCLAFSWFCKLYIPVLRTRLRDTCIAQWREGMELCSSLYLFREFKTIFERSAYLNQLHNVKYRHILATLRLSSHKLNIEIGRHNKIERQDRKCIRCNSNHIEDEFHFVLVCPDYINLRNTYIPIYYSNRKKVF